MIVRVLVGALALMILAAPSLGALPSIPLDGRIRLMNPVGLDGLVAPLPHYAFLRSFEPDARADNQTIATAARASLILYRWQEGPNPCGLEPIYCVGDPLPPVPVENLRVRLVAVEDRPQVLITNLAQNGKPPLWLNMTGARCQLGLPAAGPPDAFPEDPDQLSSPQGLSLTGSELVADCDAASLQGQDPYSSFYYGLDLHVLSDTVSMRIRTGTYEEASAPGLPPVRTTQILEVRHRASPYEVLYPFGTTVRIYASRFLAVGGLHTTESTGTLQWGDWNQTGPVAPIEATGHFSVAHAPNDFVEITGSVNEQGRPGGVESTKGLFGIWAPATWAAVGAGVVALAYAAWSLFSRLRPDRLLEHPRRAMIYDYVRRQPGVPFGQVAHELNLRSTKVIYHAARLQRGGLLAVRRFAGRSALFATGQGTRDREGQLAVLHRRMPRRVYEHLVLEPGLDQLALSLKLGAARATVSKALAHLERVSLVEARRVGATKRYSPRPRIFAGR